MEKALFEFMFSTGCRIGEIVSKKTELIGQTVLQLFLEKVIKRSLF
jgi:site-specific recombinase XerD